MSIAIDESIDLTYLKMASNGDAEFEREMMISLGKEIGEKMEGLYQYLINSDADSSRVAAHSLKNLYSILGVSSLVERYKTIEHACAERFNASSLVEAHLHGETAWKKIREQVDSLVASD